MLPTKRGVTKVFLTTPSRRADAIAQLRERSDTAEPVLLLVLNLGLKTWKLGFARNLSDVFAL
jgi:hypothetical protein